MGRIDEIFPGPGGPAPDAYAWKMAPFGARLANRLEGGHRVAAPGPKIGNPGSPHIAD